MTAKGKIQRISNKNSTKDLMESDYFLLLCVNVALGALLKIENKSLGR